MLPRHLRDSQRAKKLRFSVFQRAHPCEFRQDRRKEVRIPTVIVEDVPGNARHRPIENKFKPIRAAIQFAYLNRSVIRQQFRPFYTRGHIQQALNCYGSFSIVNICNALTVKKVQCSMAWIIEQTLFERDCN
jgi:hypothetical protein